MPSFKGSSRPRNWTCLSYVSCIGRQVCCCCFFPPLAPHGKPSKCELYGDKFHLKGFPCGSAGKESACNMGDLGSIPGLGGSPGEGKGYPLQYSVLENSMDCIVHGVAKSQIQLSDFHFSSQWTKKKIQSKATKSWGMDQRSTSLKHFPRICDPMSFNWFFCLQKNVCSKTLQNSHLPLLALGHQCVNCFLTLFLKKSVAHAVWHARS